MRNVGFVGNVGNIFGSFGTKNLFLFDIFYNIEPISVYLKKTKVYVIGLYFGRRLIGCILEETSQSEKITFQQVGMALDSIFPKNLDDLEKYANENSEKAEYYLIGIEHLTHLSCPLNYSE